MSAPRVRLFDRLLQPGQDVECGTFIRSDGEVAGAVRPVNRGLRNSIADSVRVVADEAANWLWHSQDEEWNLRNQSQFGPLRLPFSRMWIEFRTPSTMYSQRQWHAVPEEAVGVFMQSEPAGERKFEPQMGKFWPPENTAEEVTCTVVRTISRFRPHPVILEMDGTGAISADGRFLASRSHAWSEVFGGSATPPTSFLEDPLKRISRIFWDDAMIAFLAVSLMNCKNTSLQHHPAERSRSSKPGRRAVESRNPHLEYHTIQLPSSSRSTRQQKINSTGGAIPLHKVRGHFKTYTPSAPRFGRDVGTFWYDWHVRGSADNGQVISDYRVGMPSN